MLKLRPLDAIRGMNRCRFPNGNELFVPSALANLLAPFLNQWIEVRVVKGTRFRFIGALHHTFVDTKAELILGKPESNEVWGCPSYIDQALSKRQGHFKIGETYDLHIRKEGGEKGGTQTLSKRPTTKKPQPKAQKSSSNISKEV